MAKDAIPQDNTPRCPSGHRNPFNTPCQAPSGGKQGGNGSSGGKK